jgi:ribonuclease VapC
MGDVVVLDASAILAAIFGEDGGEKVQEITSKCLLSTVNLEEIRTRLLDRGHDALDIAAYLRLFKLEIVDFTHAQSIESSNLRSLTRGAGLSLGDRACLALAKERNAVAVTTDKQWGKVDVAVRVELIR